MSWEPAIPAEEEVPKLKRKAPVKKLLISLVALILVGAIVAGIFLATRNSAEPINVFAFYNIGMTEYWGDSQESSGYVQTDGIQTVFLSDTQTVTEILVSEGDSVRKGDVLMTFDTTLSNLSVERKRLDVEKLKLQLEDAKDQLEKIKRMRPMVIPAPSDDKEETPNEGAELTKAYQISKKSKYDGSTPEKALICWLRSDTALDDDIFRAILARAEKFQNQNAKKNESGSSSFALTLFSELPTETPTEAPTEEPAEDPTEPEEIKVDQFYVVFKVTSGNMSLGSRVVWQGFLVSVQKDGSFGIQFFDASWLKDHTLDSSQ